MAAITSLDTFGGSSTPLTTADGWEISDSGAAGFNEGSGVATPTSYAVTRSMSWGTQFTADHRFKITLNHGGTFSKFALYVRMQDANDITSDHYRVEVTQGSSVAPAFDDPDTIQLIKRVSNVETTITPTNSPDGCVDYPSIVGDTVSLIADRVTTGDTFEIIVVDSQLIFRVNDIPVLHEEITGVDAAGYAGIINYSGSGDNTYDNAKGGDVVGRYVDGVNGNDSNSGLLAAPWKTIEKGIKAQAAGEFVFVVAGTYSANLAVYSFSPAPRTATSFEDPIAIYAKAGSTVISQGSVPLHAKFATFRFLQSVNITYRNSFATSNNPGIQFFESSHPHMFCGGGVKDCYHQGVLITFYNTDYDGGNVFRHFLFKGNGRKDRLTHNWYVNTRDNVLKYCTFDGTGDVGNTAGYGCHYFSSTNNVNDRSSIEYCIVKNHNGTSVAGILMSRGDDMVCRGNRVHNNLEGIIVGYAAADCIVENNDIYENTNYGIRMGGVAAVSGTKVRNNTVTRNNWGIYGESNNSTATVKNNIVYNNTTSQISGTGITQTTNLTTDPSFIDPNNDDHTIDSNSAADENGTDLSAEMDAVDKLGFARPQNTLWDQGAYEVQLPPENNPVVNIASSFNGTKDVVVNITPFSISDLDGDARNCYIQTDVDCTLTFTESGTATVEVSNP